MLLSYNKADHTAKARCTLPVQILSDYQVRHLEVWKPLPDVVSRGAAASCVVPRAAASSGAVLRTAAASGAVLRTAASSGAVLRAAAASGAVLRAAEPIVA